MKQFFKLSRLIPLCLFLCVSLIVTAVPQFISFNAVPSGYSGDTPRIFKGASTVIYGEKGPQYANNEWKSFSTKENTLYVFDAYCYYFGSGSSVSAGVNTKTVEGNTAKKFLYELSKLEPTGDTAPATPNNSARTLNDTKWIQTADKYYRIPNDQEGVIYLLNEYGDYNGEGTVLSMSDDLKLLLTELYYYPSGMDTFSGDLKGNTLTVKKHYDGDSSNSLIITDFNQKLNKNKKDNDLSINLQFVATKSGTYTLEYSTRYPQAHIAFDKSISFKAKKGEPVSLNVVIPAYLYYYQLNLKCSGVLYNIYFH